MLDRPARKREALPICADSALIEVAFQPRKSESWAHADGNEVPSASHSGGVRLAVRRLGSLLAGGMGQIPAVLSGDAGEGPSLVRTRRRWNSGGESHN